MKIGGLQKLTLLDYPGLVACTIFTVGCNFRCPFCHNASLVTGTPYEDYSEEAVFEFLNSRKDKLDGVCVTGGEPLLQKDIIEFIKKIKELGYKVKLDTNGSMPEKLKELIDLKLIDYVAMDIKNSPLSYSDTAGIKNFDFSLIEKSMNILRESNIGYEFRTTIVKELHSDNDFKEISKLLKPDEKYFLQTFIDSGDTIKQGFSSPEKDDVLRYKAILKANNCNALIRGE